MHPFWPQEWEVTANDNVVNSCILDIKCLINMANAIQNEPNSSEAMHLMVLARKLGRLAIVIDVYKTMKLVNPTLHKHFQYWLTILLMH